MKHIELFEAKSSKFYNKGLVSALLSRFKTMPESWKKTDNDKLSQIFQEDISDLDDNIKNTERKLERLKDTRMKLNNQFVEYRKEYRKR